MVLAPSGQIVAAGDEAGAGLPAQVLPHPVEQHCHAVAVSDQENEVNAEPGEPGGEAGEVGFSDLADAASASNRRHAALVVIVENAAGLIADAPHDLRRRVFSRLDCNLRDSGKRRSFFFKVSEATENENL